MVTTEYPKVTDRAALLITIIIGAAVSVWTLVQTVVRIVQIAPNTDVPVTASFADTPAVLPIGQDGADVTVVAQQVVFLASDMPSITVISLILAQIAYAITVIITITCVCLVIRNIIRGQTFGRANVWLVGTATLVVAVGWVVTWLFSTMGANGGASALAGGPGANTPLQIDVLVIFAIASLGALSVAFMTGHRLQQDSEGLV